MSKIIALSVACMVIFALPSYGYSPNERGRLKLIRTAVIAGIEHGKALQLANESLAKEAESAHVEADNANKVAGMAASSAFTAGVTARKAQAEAERAAKENAEMRPIVEQVNKWCGLGAFVYGIERILHCLMWLAIGIVALVVLFFVASLIFPALGPILRLGTGFIGGVFSRIRIHVPAIFNPNHSLNTMTPPTPSTNWFHGLLTKLESLAGMHPNDPAYAAVKAEIAEIKSAHLTVDESAQLDKTLKAIEAARLTPPPAPNPSPATGAPPPAG